MSNKNTLQNQDIKTSSNRFLFLNDTDNDDEDENENEQEKVKVIEKLEPEVETNIKYESKADKLKKEVIIRKQKTVNVITHTQTEWNKNEFNNLVKENINIENFGNEKLNSKWCLWFHYDPNDWKITGYHKIETFETVDDYLKIMSHLHMVTSIRNINLYLFRENIEPTWEHEANSNGGCWSIKSTNDYGFDIWHKICDKAITENLLKTSGTKDINGAINGISITNKSMNNIVKIWVSDRKVCNNQWIDRDILNQVNSKIMYQIISPEKL